MAEGIIVEISKDLLAGVDLGGEPSGPFTEMSPRIRPFRIFLEAVESNIEKRSDRLARGGRFGMIMKAERHPLRFHRSEDRIGIPAWVTKFNHMQAIIGKSIEEIKKSRLVPSPMGRELIKNGAEFRTESSSPAPEEMERLGRIFQSP